MSKAVIMDASAVPSIDESGKSSINEHDIELNHQCDSIGTSHNSAEENGNNVDNVQKQLTEVMVGDPSSLNAEYLDAKPSFESGMGTRSNEIIEQIQAKGTGSSENGSLDTQRQVCDQLGSEKVGVAPDEGNSIGTCHNSAEENRNNVDNVQKQLTEVMAGDPSSLNAEYLDAKPSYESGMGTKSNEIVEQIQAKGTGSSENGSLDTQDAQRKVCDQLGFEKVGVAPDKGSKSPGLQQIGATQADENQPRNGKIGRGRPRKGTNTLGSPRTLRSRSQEKPTAPVITNNSAENAARKKRRKRKKQMIEALNDEFSKIRRHLRYFLTRINYEQNLIHAYAGEGWKGQSLEKIRPEKELERAKSEILRRKLKIRDLFQRIDVSCAEGRIPESLFDEQGEIDSEDIFCAKCGSTDVQLDNDIILCDGDCERGFHQFCLQPPLLKEDVPPGDEGWLCPACDCKADCIDLLNESQGTNLSISDNWEKVFPEAASVGNKLDDMGLSSDDSEDDDYNPDGPELNEEVEGDESSSDELSSDDSDFSSASEDLGAVTNNEQFLGLPSDDSEDDDYDPDKLVLDEQMAMKESSGSDFTSESEEDVSALLKDAEASTEVHEPSALDKVKENGKLLKNGVKKRTLNGELLTPLELDPRESDSSVPSGKGKRHVERLDYKRLHDEEYGCDVSSDSSDEDFSETGASKKRKNQTRKTSSVSSSIVTPAIDVVEKDKYKNLKRSDSFPKRSKKPDVKGTSSSQANSDIGSNSNDQANKTSRRLGEAATQKLYESFKKNQYPGREDKEKLANELSLTFRQVDKWFGNARWSFNHPVPGSEVGKNISKSETVVATENTKNGIGKGQLSEASPGNSTPELEDKQSPKTPTSRKRKTKSDSQETDPISSARKMPKTNSVAESPKSPSTRRSGRIQTRSGGKSTP